MPKINQYTDNTTIENDDKMLTYDTQGAATKLTAFSTIWNWIVRKLHALTSSSAALTPSTDRVLMDKNGTMTRVDPAAVAKYGIETYNGSTLAGQAQTPKAAIDALNSNLNSVTGYINTGSYNDIKRVGLFIMGSSASDGPAAGITCALINIAFSVGASASSSTVKQVALPVATEGAVYFRHFVAGSWSAWVAHSL